ncbi:hypothetical protein WA026_006718 [Henosepilachna vigintioctopunctata]|uniref:Uncharacterized protein n=1 Tax=Henosepilachna vigintioctopunctata TaxID=420089 RepID=A0AAW1UAH3_9CUCU
MMSSISDQEAFLRECEEEFSSRYTTNDPEFKDIYESDIPTPPIVFPWYGRSRFNSNRDRERDRSGYDNRNTYNRNGGGGSTYRDNNHHYNDDRRDHSEGSSSYSRHRRFNPY